MTAVTRNRELSQFGSFIYVDDSNQNVAITTDSSRFVGIGSTVPTSKLVVEGDVSISGVVTASNFYGGFIGTATNAIVADYALVAGTSGISSTTNLSTSGIITASAFYVNDALLINPEISTWAYTGTAGIGNTIYRTGSVGIGTSVGINERLVVDGNISANRITSTVVTGTAPFTVFSSTLVTNLNADFLRGKLPPSGSIVGTTDSQSLTNKTLTTPTIVSGISFSGSTSGTTTLLSSAVATGSLTLPAETGTLISTASVGVVTTGNILNGTILNEDISASASIAITKLASSTISGISLGNNLNSLSFGSYLTASGSYNGSSAISVSVAATTLNTANTIVARNASGDFTAGTITATNFSGSGALLTNIPNSATTATSANTASAIVSRDGSGDFSANIITCTDINSTSDINLKTNVNTIDNSLDIVNSLRGVSFNWKENGNKSYGVIAQEIEAVLPDLVTTKENKSVNYNGLVGVLLQAVKELSAEVEELKKKIQ